MTVTITYDHGYLDDGATRTGWSADGAHDDGNTSTLTSVDDDHLMIDVSASAGNKTSWYDYDMTNISSDTYPVFRARYKTSNSTIQAKIVLIFTAGSQEVLAETDSTTWAVVTEDITAGKTIDKIQIWATQGTGDVYYDFLLCSNDFDFPYVARDGKSGGIHVKFHRNVGELDALNRDGSILQTGGLTSPTIELTGDIDTRTEWLTGPVGKVLYLQLLQSDDSWHWFESDVIKCKVTPIDFDVWMEAGSGKQRLWSMLMKMYSRSSGKDTSWADVDWIGF